MLKQNRERAELSQHQAAAKIRVSVGTYRRIEAGEEYPTSDAFDAMCDLFGWPQTVTTATGTRVRR